MSYNAETGYMLIVHSTDAAGEPLSYVALGCRHIPLRDAVERGVAYEANGMSVTIRRERPYRPGLNHLHPLVVG